MCFSATASFVTGGALVATGVVTISKTKTKAELPFASIPLLFGIQQIVEGVLWVYFFTPLLNSTMTYTYLVFSHVLWPIIVPLSIFLLEKDRLRKKILGLFSIAGLATGIFFLYFILTNPITSQIVNHSIAYIYPDIYPLWTTVFYIAIAGGSPLLSSHRLINMFGIALFISFFIVNYFFVETLFSVWCFFAAILSIFVYLHFRYLKKISPPKR